MKKFLAIAMLILIMVAVPAAVYASETVNVVVNGIQVTFSDVQPGLVEGRTMVPLRGVFEQLGFQIDWNGATSTATMTREPDTVVVTIGDDFITVNGNRITGDVPPQIISGRFMLPLRLVAEATGATVNWDAELRTVVIAAYTNGSPIYTIPATIADSSPTVSGEAPASALVNDVYVLLGRWEFLRDNGSLLGTFGAGDVEFFADGRVTSYDRGRTHEYSVNENIINVYSPPDIRIYEFSITGDHLTISGRWGAQGTWVRSSPVDTTIPVPVPVPTPAPVARSFSVGDTVRITFFFDFIEGRVINVDGDRVQVSWERTSINNFGAGYFLYFDGVTNIPSTRWHNASVLR